MAKKILTKTARVKKTSSPKKSKQPIKVKNPTQITGKFIGNEKGFGFVQHSNGEDVFIPPRFTLGALHGDEVVCKEIIAPSHTNYDDKKSYGEILSINKRVPMVGTFIIEDGTGFVRPTIRKIPYSFEVPPKTIKRFGLADGHRVVFSVDKRHRPDEGIVACFVTEVLGHVNDPGVDVLTLVRMANVPIEFPEDVMEEALSLPTEVDESEAQGRLDIRDEFIFTIDGDDTKDIDDAISFAKTTQGFRLGVHIADVTHYVRENSALDAEALSRGTSIYLADRVIPMLPHKLSSGICSLFPNVDRLAVSCIMDLDTNGIVIDHKISTSIINSKRRYTYTEVQELLDGGEDALVNSMDELRQILRDKRRNRGALDFDIPETKIRVDENGRVISIEPYPRNNATGMIEEFMILCNETIATHFFAQQAPFVYRTHEAPSAEKIAALQEMVKTLGLAAISSKTKRPTARTLQKLLETAKDTPAAYAVSSALLRALPQANYTPNNPSHFGLASEAYCHFTSPIRRYADLQIHRIIKHITQTTAPKVFNLDSVCAQCSKTERVAEALERDVADLKKVQFMADMKGESFKAIVSGVTPWGVFVMLENSAEGLIPATNLLRHGYKFNKDYSVYEAKRQRGEKVGKILRHGSPITVRLTQANEDERRLCFVLEPV